MMAPQPGVRDAGRMRSGERGSCRHGALAPGARWVYEARGVKHLERIVVTVLPERRTVMGISTVVVRDTASRGGKVVEDMAEVVRRGTSVRVAAGRFEDVLVTKEWTPLEPRVVEKKYYAPGVGLVLERTVRGGSGRIELVEYTEGGG